MHERKCSSRCNHFLFVNLKKKSYQFSKSFMKSLISEPKYIIEFYSMYNVNPDASKSIINRDI